MVKLLDPRITYRKINSWERADFISPYRESDLTGWRKFSFAEMVQLQFVSDLKQIGVPAVILHHVLRTLIPASSGNSLFDILLVNTLRGAKNILLIGADGAVTFPQNTDGILSKIRPEKVRGPVICCPFYDYVRKVLALSGTELKFMNSFKPRSPSASEQEILEIIANEEYEHIEIIKSDGNVSHVKASARKRGKFKINDVILQLHARDYQSVTATKKGGEIVAIIVEETHKF